MNPPPPSRPQFGMRSMMLAMLMFSVLAAILGGLLQGGPQRQRFILIGVAAPVLLMVVLSIFDQVREFWRKR